MQLQRWRPGLRQFFSHAHGTRIHYSWVLTSAHCFLNDSDQWMESNLFRVVAGDVFRKGTRGLKYGVHSYHAHTDYDLDTKANDIALVKVRMKF